MTRILPPQFAPAPRPGLFRRTPPAVFPAILGLFGLGFAWRRGHDAFGLPEAPVEGYLGAVLLLYLFALVAFGAKVARRPGVLAEDFRTLPGRAGLSALSMCVMLSGAVLVPYAPALAPWLLGAGMGLLALVAAATARLLLTAPPEARQITPVLQLTFVGFIVAPFAAVPLGLTGLATAILAYCLAAAVAVWALTLRQLLAGTAPAPLRPLQAIQLAPAALTATSAYALGFDTLGHGMILIATALFGFLLVRLRWLTDAGFSGFWSSFTFPLAAYAGALFLAALSLGSETVRTAAGVVLVMATLVILPIALKVMQLWAKGLLAQKTNAATA